MNNGDILLLENVRFYLKREERSDFRGDSHLLQIFTSTMLFGTVHRSHASNVGVARYLTSARVPHAKRDRNAWDGN